MNVGAVEGFRLYPDKPTLNTTMRDRNLLGVREQKVAMVPSGAGRVTLPAIELPWWDTVGGRIRIARLPERTIEVEPAAPATSIPFQDSPLPAAEAPATVPPDSVEPDWWQALALLFSLLWIGTCLLWWRDRHAPRGRANSGAATSEKKKGPDSLRRACKDGDPGRVRAELLSWAASRWPDDPPAGLESLAARLNDPSLAGLFSALDRACYDASDAPFDGEAFYRSVAPVLNKKSSRRQTARGALVPLYPDPETGVGPRRARK